MPPHVSCMLSPLLLNDTFFRVVDYRISVQERPELPSSYFSVCLSAAPVVNLPASGKQVSDPGHHHAGDRYLAQDFVTLHSSPGSGVPIFCQHCQAHCGSEAATHDGRSFRGLFTVSNMS